MNREEIQRQIDELDARRVTLLEETASIKAQIDAANARRQMDGEHSDKHWLAKAKTALRYRGVELQKNQLQRAELAKQLKQVKAKSYERAFIDAAYRVLTAGQYMAIDKEARAIVNGEK